MAQRLPSAHKFLKEPTNLFLLGSHFSHGQLEPPNKVVSTSLIKFGLLEELQRLSYNVNTKRIHHFGALANYHPETDSHRGMILPNPTCSYTQNMSCRVYDYARLGRPILTLGSDRVVTLGTLTGISKAVKERYGRDAAFVCVNAHSSVYTPESSSTGIIGDMAVAFATRMTKGWPKEPFCWIKSRHKVNREKVVYIGIRDEDFRQLKLLQKNGILYFTMSDVSEMGMEKIMNKVLQHIGDTTPIHLSFDMNALDSKWVPSIMHPVPGGMSVADGCHIGRRLYDTGSLVGMDLVGMTRDHGFRKLRQTYNCAVELIGSALGGTTPLLEKIQSGLQSLTSPRPPRSSSPSHSSRPSRPSQQSQRSHPPRSSRSSRPPRRSSKARASPSPSESHDID